MQIFVATDDQSDDLYSAPFRWHGGPLDLEIRGIPSGATVTLLVSPIDLGADDAANYAAVDDEAVLTDEGSLQRSLPPCYVCASLTGGDGSTSLDGWLRHVDQDSLGLEPLTVSVA